MKNNLKPENLTRIHSYVKRAGRISKGQKKNLSTPHPYWLKLNLDNNQKNISFINNNIYSKKIALDIGFGMGDGTIALAKKYSNLFWIAIDVHRPGIGRLLSIINSQEIKNIRIIEGDVWDVLNCLPNNSIELMKILFPDPWPKKRHHKRRLIQNDFVNTLVSKIKPNGIVHICTDDEDYADQITHGFYSHSSFSNFTCKTPNQTTNKENEEYCYLPPTKFLKRALQAKKEVYSMLFIKHE